MMFYVFTVWFLATGTLREGKKTYSNYRSHLISIQCFWWVARVLHPFLSTNCNSRIKLIDILLTNLTLSLIHILFFILGIQTLFEIFNSRLNNRHFLDQILDLHGANCCFQITIGTQSLYPILLILCSGFYINNSIIWNGMVWDDIIFIIQWAYSSAKLSLLRIFMSKSGAPPLYGLAKIASVTAWTSTVSLVLASINKL